MDYAYRVFRNVKYFYNSINPATLSGAIDVVVVEQPNGEYKSTPFHVRFGKYGVFNYSDKYVDIAVNGEEIDLKMKLADSGVAFFVEEADEQVPDYLLTSPLPEPDIPLASGSADVTDKVLAESARKLTEGDTICDDLAKSRSSSPDGGKTTAREPKHEQSLSQVQRKQNLPFSSSVFSDRKYRSLPDLTVLADEALSENEEEVKTKKRSKDNEDSSTKRHRQFVHSHSQASPMDRDRRKQWHKSNDEILRALSKETEKKRAPLRKKSRVTFESPIVSPSKPIDIRTYNDSDSELDSSSDSPSPSLPDNVDHIADGALSDSEVDRQRHTPEPHDVTDWKWGELPETRELNKRKMEQSEKENKNKKQASSWGWWWGSSNTTTPKKGQNEEGISLDDLLNKASSDPVNIVKYLGKPPSVTSVDSGHVSRGPSQPSSPVLPVGEEYDEKTPTRESLPSNLFNERNQAGGASTSRISSEDIFPLSDDEMDTPSSSQAQIQQQQQYMQSLRLSSEKLKSLGLVHGANELRFSITTKFQGTTCDIDGTITKSDVLGHVIPAIGGTWAHAGVAELYTRIKNNGYKMVYLSSRAIGQSHTTKQYLKSVAQDSKQLPDGPVLLSPTSIITAFRKEVIERRPEEFKIAALTDLKQLFPTSNPYYAGFGNRETDVISYRAVSVPAARILIIDPSGRVRRSDSVGLVSSYTTMANDTADYLFPPLSIHVKDDHRRTERLSSAWSKPLEHSDFTHWSGNHQNSPFDVDDDELKAYEEQRKLSIQKSKK
ncbi:unnamed protein product [Caenorhabditis angaria]|uniref:LNS2/PITP domain-containing protein n=1 Tax=Caenorhabditis angaria TaxID=860376 RepID=A0A9P1N5T0_9PELO|nr:unnamed protein product [Caenorhabditis angaria]